MPHPLISKPHKLSHSYASIQPFNSSKSIPSSFYKSNSPINNKSYLQKQKEQLQVILRNSNEKKIKNQFNKSTFSIPKKQPFKLHSQKIHPKCKSVDNIKSHRKHRNQESLLFLKENQKIKMSKKSLQKKSIVKTRFLTEYDFQNSKQINKVNKHSNLAENNYLNLIAKAKQQGSSEMQKKSNKKVKKVSNVAKVSNLQSTQTQIKTELSQEMTPSIMSSHEYEIERLIGEGTFGKVYRAKVRKTGEIVAVKRVVQDSRYKNREMEIIKLLQNEFIMEVKEAYMSQEKSEKYLNIIMKCYSESLDDRMKVEGVRPFVLKLILYQLIKGLAYLHSLNICHRDIKPENVLLDGNQVVICDFGSAKILNTNEMNISYICSRCYRAPELLFASSQYSTKIDIWSAGCLLLQMLEGSPMFLGSSSLMQLMEIMKILGTPSRDEVMAMNPEYDLKDYEFPVMERIKWKSLFPHCDEELLDLIGGMMVYSPEKRLSALEVLSHAFFDELRDETIWKHISKQYKLKHFFTFTPREIQGNQHLACKLIPNWTY